MDSKQSQMLGSMDIPKLLIKLSIPATIAMLANALYNLVDTLFLAWGVGEIAIGALSIVSPLQTIIFAVGLMIGIGSASVYSRAFGRGDEETMKKVVNASLFFNGILAIILTIVGLVFMEKILYLFGATSSNIDYARDYMFYIVLSLVPFTSSLVLNNLVRAEGRANVAMISLLIGALSNIILDPIFIYDWGLGLGVAGAAIATLISKILMFIYVLYACLSKESTLKIDKTAFYDFNPLMLKEVIVIGVPTFVRNSLVAFMFIAVNHVINRYAPGDPAIYISVFGVVNRIIMFLLLPGFGLVQGMIPIVGFNYGASKYDRIHHVIKLSTKFLVIYFIISGVIMYLLAGPLFMIFTRDNDPTFIGLGKEAFRMIPLGFSFLAFQFIMSSVYQAVGYPVRAFLVALSRQLIIFLPVLYIITPYFGIQGVWISFAVADGLSGLISLCLFAYEMKIFKKKMDLTLQIA